MNILVSRGKKAVIAQGFRNKVENEEIVMAPSISEYLRTLYRHDLPDRIPLYQGPMSTAQLFTTQQTASAISRLALKATGVDQLDARVIKRPQHRQLLSM